MADTKQLRWRVQVDLSGTLGEVTHRYMANMGMTTTCIDGRDTVVLWSAARTAAGAVTGSLVWFGETNLGRDIRILKVTVTDTDTWMAEQPPLTETEQTLLAEQGKQAFR